MATIAIGDIHGNYEALDDLLRIVAPLVRRSDARSAHGGPDAGRRHLPERPISSPPQSSFEPARRLSAWHGFDESDQRRHGA